ncbi:MAG: copper chaperone PCu(A)C [Pseudomonadota bacterium]
MIKHIITTGLFAAALLAGSAMAGQPLKVENAWVRATAPGQEIAGAYLDITSAAAARLVKVETPAAAAAEIHSMTMNDGVMEMRRIDGLELPAGQTVRLAPGGYHVMLVGLKKPLKPGDGVRLRLTVERANKSKTTVQVTAAVKDAAGRHGHP